LRQNRSRARRRLEAAQKTGDQAKIAELQAKYDAIKDLRPERDHHHDAAPAIPEPRTEATPGTGDVTPPAPVPATAPEPTLVEPATAGAGTASGELPAPEPTSAPAPEPAPKPKKLKPVSGIASNKPLKGNAWGDLRDPNQHYFHDDGPLGTAIKFMGDERQMSVDGEPLGNVVGDIATDVAGRRCTAQEGVDRVKELRDRLPEWSQARRTLDMAIDKMDGPATPAPTLPAGAPEPLQTLTRELHAVPIARQDPSKELDPVVKLAAEAARGNLSKFEVRERLYGVRNKRHESLGDCGKFEIDDAVDRAMAALRKRG
jgi:hypothetical protein